jgi:hypothetical protein
LKDFREDRFIPLWILEIARHSKQAFVTKETLVVSAPERVFLAKGEIPRVSLEQVRSEFPKTPT